LIKPTIGRVVWFYKFWAGQGHKGPLAAIVTAVHSDTCVNLCAFGESGQSFGETSVRLRQPEDDVPQMNYCEWMPYQVGQAAKTEQLEKKLAAK